MRKTKTVNVYKIWSQIVVCIALKPAVNMLTAHQGAVQFSLHNPDDLPYSVPPVRYQLLKYIVLRRTLSCWLHIFLCCTGLHSDVSLHNTGHYAGHIALHFLASAAQRQPLKKVWNLSASSISGK